MYKVTRYLLVMQALMKPIHYVDHTTISSHQLTASYQKCSTLHRLTDLTLEFPSILLHRLIILEVTSSWAIPPKATLFWELSEKDFYKYFLSPNQQRHEATSHSLSDHIKQYQNSKHCQLLCFYTVSHKMASFIISITLSTAYQLSQLWLTATEWAKCLWGLSNWHYLSVPLSVHPSVHPSIHPSMNSSAWDGNFNHENCGLQMWQNVR